MYIELHDSFRFFLHQTNYGEKKNKKFLNNFSNKVLGHNDGIPLHLHMKMASFVGSMDLMTFRSLFGKMMGEKNNKQ